MIILDTNVLSETLRLNPEDAVKRWIEARAPASLFTTAICEAEILYGVALLPDGRRRAALQDAVAAIFAEDFSGRVLAFDSAAARAFAELAAARRRLGRPINDLDAQIAAIASAHGAAVATRNVDDFTDCGIEVISPWEQ
jgi:predicted nucleic acid-binding protein